MEYKVGIWDEDYHYMLNLMEYINSRSSIPLRLVAFSSEQALGEYLGKEYLDGLLLGASMDLERTVGTRVMYMVDNSNLEDFDKGKTLADKCIFKYQSVDVIAKEIMNTIGSNISKTGEAGAVFIGVYSPLGRSGKTSLARAMCHYYGDCLYVGLEDFCVRDDLGEKFLYCLLEENSQIIEVINGAKCINGILSYMDIRELTASNLKWFKNLIGTELMYGRVVFDVGVGALWDIEILSAMDVVYVPVLGDEVSGEKLVAFKELLHQTKYKGLEEGFIYVNVPNVPWENISVEEIINRR